jgi:uncharacterized membrane protein SpoIIM required for sporulation
MMTPLRFEEMYEHDWAELEALLDSVGGRRIGTGARRSTASGARIATLYRQACDQLALARARSYPAFLVDRLERITANAHQLIYHQREYGMASVRRLATIDFPSAVRAHWAYVAIAAATFLLPLLIIALLVYRRPEFILSIVGPETVASFEEMYSPAADSIGRTRDATTDWVMFAYYIRNNIGVAFQCFAGGLFGGIGSLFFLAYNGVFAGAIAGYVTERGMSRTFYSFTSTHSAFELTAVVLSGAAGLRIGHALLAPGSLTRRQSLVNATRDAAVLLYGVAAMLLAAAAIEAFWSSAGWVPPPLKFSVATVCWIAMLAYFSLQGRRAG